MNESEKGDFDGLPEEGELTDGEMAKDESDPAIQAIRQYFQSLPVHEIHYDLPALEKEAERRKKAQEDFDASGLPKPSNN